MFINFPEVYSCFRMVIPDIPVLNPGKTGRNPSKLLKLSLLLFLMFREVSVPVLLFSSHPRRNRPKTVKAVNNLKKHQE